MALELAPIRINAIHPGIVGDSPFWAAKPEAVLEGLPVAAHRPDGSRRWPTSWRGVDFLLENRGVNGIQLYVDGGWLVM